MAGGKEKDSEKTKDCNMDDGQSTQRTGGRKKDRSNRMTQESKSKNV